MLSMHYKGEELKFAVYSVTQYWNFNETASNFPHYLEKDLKADPTVKETL